MIHKLVSNIDGVNNKHSTGTQPYVNYLGFTCTTQFLNIWETREVLKLTENVKYRGSTDFLNHPRAHTLSGRIGKVVALHAEVARSIPGWAEIAPIYTMHEALSAPCSLTEGRYGRPVNWIYPIKNYSSVSGGLRETKASIWVQGSICYLGYGSVKSTLLFVNFLHIIQLDICVRALERFTNKKWRLFYSSECIHERL